MELLFLSFTTLTSTGLSDVTPVKPFARGLVMLELVAGLAYVVMLVSRLVGLTIFGQRDNELAEHAGLGVGHAEPVSLRSNVPCQRYVAGFSQEPSLGQRPSTRPGAARGARRAAPGGRGTGLCRAGLPGCLDRGDRSCRRRHAAGRVRPLRIEGGHLPRLCPARARRNGQIVCRGVHNEHRPRCQLWSGINAYFEFVERHGRAWANRFGPARSRGQRPAVSEERDPPARALHGSGL